MARKRITVIGAGNVGATTAQLLALKELGDIVLVDVVEGMPQGKSLDLAEYCPLAGLDVELFGANDYSATKGSEVVVITAGIARKPGMSRDDLLKTNTEIVKKCSAEIARTSPEAVLIVVSNPLDAMVYVAAQVTKFPKRRILGMAGVLDSARFRCFLAMELGCSVEDVHALVLGGHGDTMVPMVRFANLAGIPITELLPQAKIDAIVARTRNGGAEIVALLKTGSAYYAPAGSVVEMVEAVVKDKKRVLPVAAYCDGEYGVKGLFVGVPALLGAAGVEKVIELKLNPEELAAFQQSAGHVEKLVKGIRL
ncbi:MAG: malate dehydrogenase [Deltaproteobacteria bacterium RBG_13_61_14]|nr:MAG: malate dehydrogenase [Deltaproteobacteria bacterium RBG_13_61_14]